MNISDGDMQNQIRNMMRNFRTKPSIKWALVFIVGVFPMMIGWILFGGGDGTNKIFSDGTQTGNPIIDLGMGFQWLVAIAISAGSFIATTYIIKYNKDIKGDVYGNIIAFGWIIINFWLLPIGAWRWLTLLFMYLFAYILAQIVRLVLFIIGFKKKTVETQEMIRRGENPFKDKLTEEQFQELKKKFDELDKNNPHQNNNNKS